MIAIPPGFTVGPAITSADLHVGDVVHLPSTPAISYAGVSGHPIARLGPKNIVVVTFFTNWSGVTRRYVSIRYEPSRLVTDRLVVKFV